MAKKYYWLRLQDDFFQQPKIKKLRRVAGGDTYTVIYLKMQLLSLKNEGKLYFDGTEENFADEIALTIDEDSENVRFTVMYLLQQGLMEEVSEQEYALIETMKNIGSETSGAERVRRLREKQKTLRSNDGALHCNTDVTKCNTEKRREEERRVEKRRVEKKDKPVRHRYGEYDHVLLSDEDMQKLQEEFPNDWMNRIRNLDEYIEKTGKSYNNHLLVIRTWARKDAERKPKDRLAFIDEMVERMEKEKGADDGIF